MFIPHYKRGKKGKDSFNMTQRATRTVVSILEASSHYFQSKAFDILGRIGSEYTLDQVYHRQPCPIPNFMF